MNADHLSDPAAASLLSNVIDETAPRLGDLFAKGVSAHRGYYAVQRELTLRREVVLAKPIWEPGVDVELRTVNRAIRLAQTWSRFGAS